jgi:ubiquinone/menaquinone biosynthesis C-methylase UbiE
MGRAVLATAPPEALAEVLDVKQPDLNALEGPGDELEVAEEPPPVRINPFDPSERIVVSGAETGSPSLGYGRTGVASLSSSNLQPEEMRKTMSLRTRIFALMYDRQIAGAENAGLRALRERLLAGASGDVIEIGGGTGLNLSWYGPDVRSLTITEPEPPMLRRLERRAREHRPSARVLRASAEDLPFEDHTFDVAVSTLVLCGVDDQPRALRELRRVLRPGGRLLFIEHVRSGDPDTARLQDRLNWLHRAVVGCDCNRPTLDSIRSAGYTVAQVEDTELPKAPKFVRPAVAGSATAASSS